MERSNGVEVRLVLKLRDSGSKPYQVSIGCLYGKISFETQRAPKKSKDQNLGVRSPSLERNVFITVTNLWTSVLFIQQVQRKLYPKQWKHFRMEARAFCTTCVSQYEENPLNRYHRISEVCTRFNRFSPDWAFFHIIIVGRIWQPSYVLTFGYNKR